MLDSRNGRSSKVLRCYDSNPFEDRIASRVDGTTRKTGYEWGG